MRARVVLHENMNEAETAALCVYNLFGAAPDEKALLSRKKKKAMSGAQVRNTNA